MLTYIFIAIVSAILAFIPSRVVIFLVNLFVTPKRIIDITKNGKYQTVTAHYRQDGIDLADKHGNYTFLYEYEVDNYKGYHSVVSNTLSTYDEIKLYYINNPKYAKPSLSSLSWKEIGISKKTKRIIFGIVTFAIFVTFVIGWKLRY
jgi:hypothetical protein